MRKVFPVIILFLIFTTVAIAEEIPNEEIPPNMEVITIRNVRYIVPKGMKLKADEAGILRLETRDEYVARTFYNMDVRLKTLEENEKKLRSDIIGLFTEIINKLQTGLKQQESNLKNLIEAR